MHRPLLPRFLLLFGLVALLAGCGSAGKLGGVTATLVTIKSAQPALLETQAVMTVRYTNENVVPVGFSGSKHKLYLNGTYVGQAVSDQPVGLPQLSTTTQDIVVNISNVAMLNTLRKMSEQAQAAYRLESVLFVTAGEERMDIKTSSEGAVDLTGLKLP